MWKLAPKLNSINDVNTRKKYDFCFQKFPYKEKKKKKLVLNFFK